MIERVLACVTFGPLAMFVISIIMVFMPVGAGARGIVTTAMMAVVVVLVVLLAFAARDGTKAFGFGSLVTGALCLFFPLYAILWSFDIVRVAPLPGDFAGEIGEAADFFDLIAALAQLIWSGYKLFGALLFGAFGAVGGGAALVFLVLAFFLLRRPVDGSADGSLLRKFG